MFAILHYMIKTILFCSFAWLELVSHRSFMPKLLMCNSQKGWPFFQRLLVALFKFMEPYLRNAELPEAVRFVIFAIITNLIQGILLNFYIVLLFFL